MIVPVWLSISIIFGFLGVGSVGASVLLMNAHHKQRLVTGSSQYQQLPPKTSRRDPGVVSGRLAPPPRLKGPASQPPIQQAAPRKRAMVEEMETIRFSPPVRPARPPQQPRTRSGKIVTKQVRECNTPVLCCWWAVTVMLWFMLILQAVFEVTH